MNCFAGLSDGGVKKNSMPRHSSFEQICQVAEKERDKLYASMSQPSSPTEKHSFDGKHCYKSKHLFPRLLVNNLSRHLKFSNIHKSHLMYKLRTQSRNELTKIKLYCDSSKCTTWVAHILMVLKNSPVLLQFYLSQTLQKLIHFSHQSIDALLELCSLHIL